MSEKSIDVDIDQDRKMEIWSDIIKSEFTYDKRKEGEITVEEFAQMAEISISHARKKLNDLVEKGEVTKRYFVDGKYRRVLVYYPNQT